MIRWRMGFLWGGETFLYNTIMVVLYHYNAHLSKPTYCTTQKGIYDVNLRTLFTVMLAQL